jgi:hypothetical protein
MRSLLPLGHARQNSDAPLAKSGVESIKSESSLIKFRQRRFACKAGGLGRDSKQVNPLKLHKLMENAAERPTLRAAISSESAGPFAILFHALACRDGLELLKF